MRWRAIPHGCARPQLLLCVTPDLTSTVQKHQTEVLWTRKRVCSVARTPTRMRRQLAKERRKMAGHLRRNVRRWNKNRPPTTSTNGSHKRTNRSITKWTTERSKRMCPWRSEHCYARATRWRTRETSQWTSFVGTKRPSCTKRQIS